MKNSSRLLLVMARNLRRSSAGTVGSHASSSTRSLNAIQDNSRLMNQRDSDSDCTGAAGSGGGTTASPAGRTWACDVLGTAATDVGAPSIPGLYMRCPTEASDGLTRRRGALHA